MVTKEDTKKMKEKKVSRREVIAAGLTGLAGLAVVSGLKPAQLLAQPNKTPGQKTSIRYGMVIDLRRCIGCHACSIACKSEFDVALGVYRSWVNYAERGNYPNVRRFFFPRLCNHCENAPCAQICPVKATTKRDDGIVVIDQEKCIGCRYCMQACPYGARYFNWRREPNQGKTVSPARKWGVVDKCDFCVHRVDKGIVPSCVNTCVGRARIFGNLNDPKSEVARLISSNATTVMNQDLGTKPSVYYIGADMNTMEGAPKGGR